MPGQVETILSKIREETLWQGLILIIVMIVLIRLIIRVKAYLHEDDDPSSVDNQMLVEITELQRRGEISTTEYRSIKGRLVDRLTSNEKVPPDHQSLN